MVNACSDLKIYICETITDMFPLHLRKLINHLRRIISNTQNKAHAQKLFEKKNRWETRATVGFCCCCVNGWIFKDGPRNRFECLVDGKDGDMPYSWPVGLCLEHAEVWYHLPQPFVCRPAPMIFAPQNIFLSGGRPLMCRQVFPVTTSLLRRHILFIYAPSSMQTLYTSNAWFSHSPAPGHLNGEGING